MPSSRTLSLFQKTLLQRKRESHQQFASNSQNGKKSNAISQRREPNPEYHHAPSTYAINFKNFHQKIKKDNVYISHWNARYRWADFRRRMIYGTHDI